MTMSMARTIPIPGAMRGWSLQVTGRGLARSVLAAEPFSSRRASRVPVRGVSDASIGEAERSMPTETQPSSRRESR
jgi:hypothetical protein